MMNVVMIGLDVVFQNQLNSAQCVEGNYIKKLQVELEEAKTATIKEEYSKLNGKWIKIIHAAYDYNPTPEELDRYQVSYALIDAIDCVNEITSDCNSV